MEPEPELDFDSTPTVAEQMRRERASILKQPSKSSLRAASLSLDSDEEDDPGSKSAPICPLLRQKWVHLTNLTCASDAPTFCMGSRQSHCQVLDKVQLNRTDLLSQFPKGSKVHLTLPFSLGSAVPTPVPRVCVCVGGDLLGELRG
jgi:hypothetical protein